jgi:predicted RNA-binding Zn ribbon-like protein
MGCMTIELWEDLLNSDWHDYLGSGRREDRIDDPAWFERFTAPWRSWLDGAPPGEVRAALKNLRRVLRTIVDRIASGRNVPAAALAELDALVVASPLVRRIGTKRRNAVDDTRAPGPEKARASVASVSSRAGGAAREPRRTTGYALSFVPLEPGPAAMIAEIAAAFAETLSRGDPSRIKVCGNRDCLWVFYDRSKNRSRRWCEGNTGCGNLMKVRRFRKRRSGQSAVSKRGRAPARHRRA